jgi:hypothetical protein
MIQKGARNKFETSGLPLCCFFCGYDRHVDIAHKRGVMAFPGTAMIDEINDLNNLIPLCPNHHREADSGMIDLGEVKTLGERFGYFGFIPTPHTKKRPRNRRRQCGSVTLKERKKGPDVWVFRYKDGNTYRSITLGDEQKYPSKDLAQEAAESVRRAKKREFPHCALEISPPSNPPSIILHT